MLRISLSSADQDPIIALCLVAPTLIFLTAFLAIPIPIHCPSKPLHPILFDDIILQRRRLDPAIDDDDNVRLSPLLRPHSKWLGGGGLVVLVN